MVAAKALVDNVKFDLVNIWENFHGKIKLTDLKVLNSNTVFNEFDSSHFILLA